MSEDRLNERRAWILEGLSHTAAVVREAVARDQKRKLEEALAEISRMSPNWAVFNPPSRQEYPELAAR